MQTPFAAYLLLWSAANLLRIQVGFNAGTGLVGSTMDRGALLLPLLVLGAGLFPTRGAGALPFAAMLVRALTNLAKGSFMSNSQMWATQMDAAVLCALATCVWRRPASKRLTPLSPAEEVNIIGTCARTIRWQLALFYFASGFWKLNTSFLHPDYCALPAFGPRSTSSPPRLTLPAPRGAACASLFMVQPLEYLPDAWLFAPADAAAGALVRAGARLIVWSGPAATLLLEAVVPALHALPPARFPRLAAAGVALTLVRRPSLEPSVWGPAPAPRRWAHAALAEAARAAPPQP